LVHTAVLSHSSHLFRTIITSLIHSLQWVQYSAVWEKTPQQLMVMEKCFHFACARLASTAARTATATPLLIGKS
jgi:hypothetical protein